MSEFRQSPESRPAHPDYHEVLRSFQLSDPAPGPFANGLRPADRILISSFANPHICGRFCHELAAAGIKPSVVRDGIRLRVEVRFADKDRAFALLDRQKQLYPDVLVPVARRDFDFTIFGGVFGTLLGLPLLFNSNKGFGIVGCIGLITTGLVFGYSADHVVRNYRFTGRMQFSVFDCFLFTFVVALLISFWTSLARIILR